MQRTIRALATALADLAKYIVGFGKSERHVSLFRGRSPEQLEAPVGVQPRIRTEYRELRWHDACSVLY